MLSRLEIKFLRPMLIALVYLAIPGHLFGDEVIWDGNKVQLTTQEIAEGVYAVIPQDAAEKNPQGLPVATSGGFIVGERGVLVVDSMINGRLATQLIGLIRRVTPKPIRYVVNTSYHGDHSYGNYVFPETAAIVQHPETERYIAEKFDEDRAFMMQNFGKGRGIEEVVPRAADLLVDKSLRIDLGGVEVQILHLGFAQTEGDLFVWLPSRKVLFTGNPFIAERPALPWLLDGRHAESLATMRRVWDLLPADATIVPGHGQPTKRDGMKFTIDYLETLDRRVKKSLAEGKSLDEAVADVTMEEFKGYAIWDWVHSQINVPATYRELTPDSP